MILNKPLTCTHQAITTDVPLQIWESLTSSSAAGLPHFFIRALHNKPRYYFTNYTQCYFHYLSPGFHSDQYGFLGLFIYLLALMLLYRLFTASRFRRLGLLFLLYPIIYLFELYS